MVCRVFEAGDMEHWQSKQRPGRSATRACPGGNVPGRSNNDTAPPASASVGQLSSAAPSTQQ